LYLAIAGTVLFVLFLPAYLSRVRDGGSGRFALGLLLGLALDTALHGAFGSYDVAWQAGLGALLLILLLVLVQWLSLVASLRTPGRDKASSSDGPFWPTLAVGPFLFLQLLIFQNIARLTALTGWMQPLVFGWVLLSQVAGLAMAAWILSQSRRGLWPITGLLGAGLIFAVAVSTPGVVAASLFLAGQIAIAVLLAVILAALDARAAQTGLARTTVAHGIGMILLGVLLFLFYGAFDIRLPFSNTTLPPVAAFIIGLCAFSAVLVLPAEPGPMPTLWQPAVLVLILLVLPLVGLMRWRMPEPVAGDGYPVRIMTYNLHNGFNTDGFLGMEALARVIESEQPDVVALQEVSRGWVIAGSLDMLTWLSQRLGMSYVSGPTAGPLWGNAILSRLPIREYQAHALPPRDLLIRRGFLWARIDVGGGEELDVIATHYHNPEPDSAIRVEQSRVILDFWGGADRTALLGDLNGRPGDPEIEMLRQAGLRDVLDLAGISPGYTNPSNQPRQRIDYIWITPDLAASDVLITSGTASDHLGVVATVGR
ncbi:MAG: endonuclease, partial [Chloroflexi bacterium]